MSSEKNGAGGPGKHVKRAATMDNVGMGKENELGLVGLEDGDGNSNKAHNDNEDGNGHGVTPGNTLETGLDENKYQQWTKKEVLIWLKANLLNNGLTVKEAKSFLKEFSSKRITGGTLYIFKNNDEKRFNESINQLKSEFSYENQAFGIWIVIKASIENLGQ